VSSAGSSFTCSKLTDSEDRVRAGAAKLSKMLAAKQQGRLDGFFTVKPKEGDAAKGKGKKDDKKRKGDDKGGTKKKGKK
jgi:flap endonuclease-1